jgi:hypothetical protein
VHRIIYVGNSEIFGYGVSRPNGGNNINWTGGITDNITVNAANNLAFLRNVCAWMVNVVQQGNEFTDQFKP